MNQTNGLFKASRHYRKHYSVMVRATDAKQEISVRNSIVFFAKLVHYILLIRREC